MLERAEARFKPFAELDFNLMAAKLPEEDYNAVREEAKKAYEDVKFLTEEIGSFMQAQEAKRIETFRTAAAECIKVLEDPKTGIQGWSQETYNQLREYVTSAGMSGDLFNSITDPAIFKILHNAWKYETASKQAVAKKKNTAPKKVLTKKGAVQTKRSASAGLSALAALKARGDRESAAKAFMARWDESSGEE
jgi:hypothetical protein